MTDTVERRTPWILWPFVALWRVLTFILEITSRILCAIFGLIIAIVGSLITMSVIGAPIGIPIAIFGVLLIVRALF